MKKHAKTEDGTSSGTKRYRHKLNMLEPGTKMLKWTGILLAVGFALYLLRLKTAAYCVTGLAGASFAVLVILLIVEAHQDKVLNEIALREDRENERSGK